MMACPITAGVKLNSGPPRLLFDTGLSPVIVGRDQYGVTATASVF